GRRTGDGGMPREPAAMLGRCSPAEAHELSGNGDAMHAKDEGAAPLRHAAVEQAEERLIDVRLFLAVGQASRLRRERPTAREAAKSLNALGARRRLAKKTFLLRLATLITTKWAH